MKTSTLAFALSIIVGATFSLQAEEAGSAIPYNSVNRTMTMLKSQKVDGVDCVPFYLKSTREGEPLDAKKAKFHIRTWDGEMHLLKLTLLSEIPADKRTDIEKQLAKQAYTHILWIPKDVKQYLDGDLVHNLPKGSIDMTQGIKIAGSVGPGAEKKQQ
ncbi:MAG: hypothetical protein J0M04_13805 [Verrucomicrobia bacterium]|nr:hypothetical protein [Verrucomicrobiota bacterium]